MPTPTPCPGPCNNAWRRAQTLQQETGTPHDLTPTWGRPTQCDSCTERAHQQLAELPELTAAIRREALYGTRAPNTTTIHARTGNTPPWPGQAAHLLTEHIWDGIQELADDIATLRRLPTPICINPYLFLDGHLDWALQHHPAAGEPHDPANGNPAAQIRGWHSAAQRFTKNHPQHDTRRLAPCPSCRGPYLTESRDLRLVDDQPYIECRDPDCRRILTAAEYATYVRALTNAANAAA